MDDDHVVTIAHLHGIISVLARIYTRSGELP